MNQWDYPSLNKTGMRLSDVWVLRTYSSEQTLLLLCKLLLLTPSIFSTTAFR